MEWSEIKNFRGGGMDQDSAPEDVAANDYFDAVNFRNTGTEGSDLGYENNIEGMVPLTGSLPAGVNNMVGGGEFDDTAQIVGYRYNSAGNCEILLYSQILNTYSVIYTDLTNSAGISFLPLNPQNPVLAILINRTYLVWWAKGLEVGYTNLLTLATGGYGSTLLWEDLSLLKPQCMIPPTGVYGSDAGRPANYFYGLLPQLIVQYVNIEFNKSAWSTRSKRIVPYQQNTPILGQNVGQNNYIIVAVNIGSIRVVTVSIGVQFDDSGNFSIFKSVDTAYIKALPNTSVNVATEIYEAYDPATNLYYYVWYNNTLLQPILSIETNLGYDYIWPSNSAVLLNGNIIGIADFNTLYDRPQTSVTIAAVGYNPNIDIPAGTYANPLVNLGDFPGASGSGAGNHRRNIWIQIGGSPNTGDTIVIITADIRNASAVMNHTYTVPGAQAGNLAAVVASIAATLGGSYVAITGGYRISWTDIPYYGLQTYSIELFFSGATVANSVPEVLDNTTYQAAFGYFDYKGRYFPLDTDNTFIINTPSFAQQNGNATQISVQINTANAPAGAVGFQPLLTKPPVTKVLSTISTLIVYKGAWDAKANSPTLTVNSGNIGDTYQITTPASPSDPTNYHNLGTGDTYNTGDYVTNVGGNAAASGLGQYYALLPRSFGDLTNIGASGILVFSLNSLMLLNSEFNEEGVTTNLVYDFAQGDRCTLHYWIDAFGNKNYFNNPCIDLAVLGYDAGINLVKVENSAALTFGSGHIYYNGNQIDATNIFIRLYSPQPQTQTASIALNETVWYEVGQYYPITAGIYQTYNFNITDGGAYFKTRQFPDAIQPYTNPPINVIATDLNYSDFYPSDLHSFGRARIFNDELIKTERKASIVTSQPYVLGSQNNGLNRFYPSTIYGDGYGQTSSSKGAIQIMRQVGSILRIYQELGIFMAPINITYTQINADNAIESNSPGILINLGRYDEEGVGIGLTKCFCSRYGIDFFVDPNKSLPYMFTGRAELISKKMSKFFKGLIQAAYQRGNKLQMFYNDYYEEVPLTIQPLSGSPIAFAFGLDAWNPFNNYNILASDVSATPNGAHSTASYNGTTGVVTYTPSANYIGNDSATFTFNPGSGNITLNNCLNWIAGTTTVNPFNFAPQTGVPLSTLIQSNAITVIGPNIAVPISITGGQYSINGSGFTSAAGTVNPGDSVVVEVMSSASFTTATSTTLTISATTGTFTVTTRANANFTASAQYGVSIISITGTGVPAGFLTVDVTPGNSLSLVYTTLAIGVVQITVSGTPVLPAKIVQYVAGVDVGHVNITFSGNYTITNTGTVNDPTSIDYAINLQ